jgi:dihydroorotate dehydrogenase (NAD+) catalytic subunit
LSSGLEVVKESSAKVHQLAKGNRIKKPDPIPIELCGFHINFPTMLASGVLGISFDLFPRIILSGCGAIVSKSIGTEPRAGYKNPTMTGVEAGYLNAIGLANPGVEIFARELEEFSRDPRSASTPLVISIFADTSENFAHIVRTLDEFKFLAFELNLSCPHVKDVGSEIGGDLALSTKVIESVKGETDRPVFAKMPASIMNAPKWGKAIEKAGADAIVAINTVRAMSIDLSTQRPVLSNRIGGLSGSAIRPIGVAAVYELFDSLEIPIIGVGGVFDWSHAVEYFLAGARCVQVGSAMATGFIDTFSEIDAGVASYMAERGYSSLKEMVGAAHK